MLLLIVLLFAGACSNDGKTRKGNNPPEQKTEVAEETT